MNAIIMIQSGTLKIGEKGIGLINTIKKPLICRLFFINLARKDINFK